METILLISASSAMESRLGDLLDSPRHIARISSWSEAFRLLADGNPAAVIVGPRLGAFEYAQQMAQLDQLLASEGRPIFLVSQDPDDEVEQWPSIFPSLEQIFAIPDRTDDWNAIAQVLRSALESAQSASSKQQPPPGASREESSDESRRIEITLPDVQKGQLDNVSLDRLLYTFSYRQVSGVLGLRSNTIDRRFAIVDGQFAQPSKHHDAEALTSAFAWNTGSYAFKTDSPNAEPTASLAKLIVDGLRYHSPQRQLMEGLTLQFPHFPQRTQLQAPDGTPDWPILDDFLSLCDGERSLETIFGQLGARINDAFRAATFCRACDLIHFAEQPTTDSVTIVYDKASSQSSTDPASPTLAKTRRANNPDDHVALEDDLQTSYNTIEDQSDHEIFGLWKGCGREAVKEAYYRMVKEHHPDVYGGNISPDIRRLAQQIFVAIRKAYSRLLRTEHEQTVPPPDQRSEATPERQQPGRKNLQTLRPDQFDQSDLDAINQPSRTPQSTPIAMGREPTAPHPTIGPKDNPSSKPTRKTSSKSKDRPSSKPRRRPTTSGRSSAPKRRSSSHGLGDQASNPEWRKKQLERLQKKSSAKARRSTTRPGSSPSSDPTRDTFNLGYKQFRDQRYNKALPHLEKAHQADKDNPLYTTFFAYCLFQVDGDKAKEARSLLEEALEAGDRQSLPDTHLFLGHVLKAMGKEKRAYRHFRKVRNLNPSNRDAEREIRLYEKRHNSEQKKQSRGGFFKGLFKD